MKTLYLLVPLAPLVGAILAGFFGSRFNEKPYFKSQAGADVAPKVKF